jgi:hypothetical protein
MEQLNRGDVSLSIARSVMAVRQGDNTVLLDYGRGEYYGLDGVATAIWEALNAHNSFLAIVDSIAEHFDVSRERATSDVAVLLSELANRGLIQVF